MEQDNEKNVTGNQAKQSEIILTPDIVASLLEETILDLQGFILPTLEAETGSVDLAVICEMNIVKLQRLATALKGGA